MAKNFFMSLKAQSLVVKFSDYYYGFNPYNIKNEAFFKLTSTTGNVTFWHYRYWGNELSQGSDLSEIYERDYIRCKHSLLVDAEKYKVVSEENGAKVMEYDDGKFVHTLEQMVQNELEIRTEATLNGNAIAFHDAEINYLSEDSPVADFVGKAAAEYREFLAQKAAEKAADNKKYAQKCGRTARRLDMNFVNVLRMGYEDEEKLLAFKKSMERAKQMFAASDYDTKAYLYHEIMDCGRERMTAALASLGIIVEGVDVKYMDWRELFQS